MLWSVRSSCVLAQPIRSAATRRGVSACSVKSSPGVILLGEKAETHSEGP